MTTMRAAYLPGNSTVELREVPIPSPGPGQVLLRMRASSICGSDVRAIWREHLGTGDEAYRGVVAGHEPCGEVVETGPEAGNLAVGDRVAVYHIRGCGRCGECRLGYMIGCTSADRAAYGWQRDGGHAEYLLADAVSCIALPDELTFEDGALVACGFGTAFEALQRGGTVDGTTSVLVTGLGPVGLAAAMLARAMGAPLVVGSDPSPDRRELASQLGLVDLTFDADADLDELLEPTRGFGYEVAVDCSGAATARLQAVGVLRRRGRCVLVGEGGGMELPAVSDLLIHKQASLHGSWVTSLGTMQRLLEQLARWELHPDQVVTHRFPLEEANAAYELTASQAAGKVCIVMPG